MSARLVAALAVAAVCVSMVGVGTAGASEGSDTSVARADCGPGSLPETGLQGQVPLHDRLSGRSKQGYRCNLELLGQYQGNGAGWVDPSYEKCAYMTTSVGGSGVLTNRDLGVQVIDVSDPKHPRRATSLTSPAMLTDPWESLKVSNERGLLAGVSGGTASMWGGLFFDVYDISKDCTKPRLLNPVSNLNLTLPTNALGHEGAFSPDSRTYWASGLVAGSLTAISIDDPTHPRIVFTGLAGVPVNHGMSFSDDGNTMYLSTMTPAGFVVLDVSDIQQRKPLPQVRELSRVTWRMDFGISQMSVPVTYAGSKTLITTDESGQEVIHIYDVNDPRNPRLIRHLQLEINQPEHIQERREDTTGDGILGYEAHYCTVNRPVDPTAMACGFFQSGIRVFDIRDPRQIREIAYFNPPAQTGKNAQLGASHHAQHLVIQAPPISDMGQDNVGTLFTERYRTDLTADWCSSPPRFVGTDQLWVTCNDNGFLVLKFTNGAYQPPGPRSRG